MKLQRYPINTGSHRGIWYFTIVGNEGNTEAELKQMEEVLCKISTGQKVGRKEITWGNYCDHKPDYATKHCSGFWIPMELYEALKEAWKQAKEEYRTNHLFDIPKERPIIKTPKNATGRKSKNDSVPKKKATGTKESQEADNVSTPKATSAKRSQVAGAQSNTSGQRSGGRGRPAVKKDTDKPEENTKPS